MESNQDKDNAKEWKYGIGCELQYVKEIYGDFEVLEIPTYTGATFTCIGAMPNAIQNQWKRVYSECRE